MKKRQVLFPNSLKGFFQVITASKFLVSAVIFVMAAIPLLALAQFGLEYGTLTGLGTQDLRLTIMKIARIFLSIVGIIALIIIIYAGFVWMTSAGNPEKIDAAKKTLRNAVIGLIIIFLALAIVQFILNQLSGAIGAGPGGGGPRQPCENCDHLGRGIIQSVYPEPYARDVARNTIIMVTFKVPMELNTIIANCTTLPCNTGYDLVSDNVRIYKDDDKDACLASDRYRGQSGRERLCEDEVKLADNEVVASSADGKTFVFKPKEYLGSADLNTWYKTKLTDGIMRSGGTESAFPGAKNYFSWTFEIGTYIDLDPPEIVDNDIFPAPDVSPDIYRQSQATLATGVVSLNALPRTAHASEVGTAVPDDDDIPDIMVASGNYNCIYDALICVNHNSGQLQIEARNASATDCTDGSVITVPGLRTTANVSDSAASIGCGLIIQFTTTPPNGTLRWRFNVVAPSVADTLGVDTRNYTFVASAPGANQIQVDTTLTTTAQNIVAKINADNLAVEANLNGDRVDFTAKLAGEKGNRIPIITSTYSVPLTPLPVVGCSQDFGDNLEVASIYCRANPDDLTCCQPWAGITAMSGGTDSQLGAQKVGADDVARNAIITFDFNEAINVAELPTETVTPIDGDPDVDDYQKPDDCEASGNTLEEVKQYCIDHTTDGNCCAIDSRIKVEYYRPWPIWPEPAACGQTFANHSVAETYCTNHPTNNDCCGSIKAIWPTPAACTQTFDDSDEAETYCTSNPTDLSCCISTWTPAAGAILHSNQYRTVEFIPDGECLDPEGLPIINSCGEKVYCLPVFSPDPYAPTNYRVVVKAGLLKICTVVGDCPDSNFNVCIATPGGDMVCQSSTGVFYPEAQSPSQGIVDAASNSFNGNMNTQSVAGPTMGRADGPQVQSNQAPYNLTSPDSALGDDLLWTFFVNKNVELEPPFLEAVGPNVGANAVSLTLPIDDTFNEIMMSSTLKPGTNYLDGLCQCRKDHNEDCKYEDQGEYCDVLTGFTTGKCKNESSEQIYCERDADCKDDRTCINKKYLSLIDNSSFGVAYWVNKYGLDTVPPLDGRADKTQAQVDHTKFLEVTNYGSEVGSGVKDAYQNCYKPSKGAGMVCRDLEEDPATPAAYGNACTDDDDCETDDICVFLNHCSQSGALCERDSNCGMGERCTSICSPNTPGACCQPPLNDPTRVYCCEGLALTQTAYATSTCFTGY